LRKLAAAIAVIALGLAGCEQEREILDVETPEGGIEVRETDEGLEIETKEKGD
jgi:hypothetical protein